MTWNNQVRILPADFQFSQSCLRDFTDCPYRFLLRYIHYRVWPAAISEPAMEHERRMLLGNAFHRIVQQHLAGIVPERITAMLGKQEGPGVDDLRRWWTNYLAVDPAGGSERHFPEYTLRASLAGYSLVAKYDLLYVDLVPGDGASQVHILDWKTNAHRTKRSDLLGSWQTRVYRYLVVKAGAHLNGGTPPTPHQVRMTYWFAEQPHQPECLEYTLQQYLDDERTLTAAIMDITSRHEQDFVMSRTKKACRFCVYRSLCDRGVKAGIWEGEEDIDQTDISLDLDKIEEIAF